MQNSPYLDRPQRTEAEAVARTRYRLVSAVLDLEWFGIITKGERDALVSKIALKETF